MGYNEGLVDGSMMGHHKGYVLGIKNGASLNREVYQCCKLLQ